MANSKFTPTSSSTQLPISGESTQLLPPNMESRRLTVSYGPRSARQPDGRSESAPSLRLHGAWLQRAGFGVGVRVNAQVGVGRLVVEAIDRGAD
jgi:type I toxin-antitoxin system toxin SymE